MVTERMIDTALCGYTESGPVGLAERVLDGIRIAQASRRRSRRLVVLSIGLAAALSYVIVEIGMRQGFDPPPTPKIAQVWHALPAPVGQRHADRQPLPKRRLHRVPGPGRLTGEESALLSLVKWFPRETPVAFKGIERQSIKPIDIAAIEIEQLPGYDEQ